MLERSTLSMFSWGSQSPSKTALKTSAGAASDGRVGPTGVGPPVGLGLAVTGYTKICVFNFLEFLALFRMF